MGIIIAFFTNLYGGAVALGAKLCAAGVSFATGLLARLGIKLLSYGWISKAFEIAKKVLSVIKKIAFNNKVLAAVKYLLAMGLCALALTQIYFTGIAVYENIDQIITLVTTPDVISIIFLGASAIGIVTTVICCLIFIFKLFKKQIKLNFVPAMFFTYLIIRFLSASLNVGIMLYIVNSFNLIDAFAIVLLGYVFIKLFDKTYPASFFGLLFTAVSILVAFIVFKSANFGALINFEVIGEISFVGKDIGLVSAIKALISPQQATGAMYIVSCGVLEFSSGAGEIVASIVLAVSIVAIIIGHLLPYVLISCVIGLVMGLINDRQPQYKYLSKVIKTLLAILITVVIAFVLVLAVTLIEGPANSYFVISQNLGALFFTLGMTLIVMITTAIARSLFARKIY